MAASPHLHLWTYATDPTKIQHLPGVTNLAITSKWNSYHDKLEAVKRHIQWLPPTDVVCFTDAYDALYFPSDSPSLLSLFQSTECDLLLSAETNCYPWFHVASLYPSTVSPYKYLHSGGYIGTVAALKQLFALSYAETPCDQGFFTFAYINYLHDKASPLRSLRILLDSACRIFQTAYGVPWSHFYIQSGTLYNRDERTTPHFLHFNGNYHYQKDKTSILPQLAAYARDQSPDLHTLPPDDTMLHPILISVASATAATPTQETPYSDAEAQIRAAALEAAATFVVPDRTTIMERDEDNYHAIWDCAQGRFPNPVSEKSIHREFALTNRRIVELYLGKLNLCRQTALRLDISLHDFVGVQMNTDRWPHSILGFSKDKDDHHNALLPDLYAMQNYRGLLNQKDNLPTTKKLNRLLFIGVSSGISNVRLNTRIQLCRFAKGKDWIEAYLSGVVNFAPEQAAEFSEFVRPKMSLDEQFTYRHLMVVDGNTVCWDRLPWVLASRSVCWKLESDDECWYDRFLKPWVHYVPFRLDTLEETWEKVKDDKPLQLRLVKNANRFAAEFLSERAHRIWTTELLNGIVAAMNA